MNRLVLGVLLISAAGATLARADDHKWVHIADSKAGPVYLDAATVRFSASTEAFAWEKTIYKSGGSQVRYWRFNHSQNSSRITLLAWVEYAPNGEVVSSADRPNGEGYRIIPESTGEALDKFVFALAPGAKPRLENFNTLEDYQEALTTWVLDQREAAGDKPRSTAAIAKPKPHLEDFKTLEGYQEALTNWILDQREAARGKSRAQ